MLDQIPPGSPLVALPCRSGEPGPIRREPWLLPDLSTAPFCWSTQTHQRLIRALDSAASPFDVERILQPLRRRGCPQQFVEALRQEARRNALPVCSPGGTERNGTT